MEGTIIYNISAIVPVYNVEEYLKTSVDSLANQTIKNIEIIYQLYFNVDFVNI